MANEVIAKGPILEDPIRQLSEKDQKAFLDLWELQRVSAGTLLENAVDHSPVLLYVLSGRVQVRLKLDSSDLLIKTVSENQSFGISELALGVLRSNKLIAEENCEVLLTTEKKVLDFFENQKKAKPIWQKFCQEIRLRDELRIHPFFRKLTMHELVELSQLLKKREISSGEVIIEEGTISSSVLFIQSGRFRITKSSWAAGFSSMVEAGSVLGEMGVLEKKARNATVTAMEKSVVYELMAEDAIAFFQKSESLYSTLRSVSEERKWNQRNTEEETESFAVEEAFFDSVFFIPDEVFKPVLSRWRGFPFLIEEAQEETAQACRSMLLKAYGVAETEVSQETNFPRYDSEITNASWKLAFPAELSDTFIVELDHHKGELSKRIWIGRWEENRYVVVYEYGEQIVKVADPSSGLLEYSRSEFDSKIGIEAITVQWKTTPATSFVNRFSLFPGITGFLSSTYSYFFSGIIASFIIKALQIGLPILNLYIIDSVLLKESKEHFSLVILSIFLFSLSQILLSYLRTNVLFYSASKINQIVVIRFLEKLLSFPLPFFERNKKGEILQRWEELETITHFFSEQGAIKILDLVFGMVVVFLFFFLSPHLLMIVLFLLVPELYILFRVSPEITAETKKENLRAADTLSYFIETLNGHETIKNLGAMSVQRWDFEKRLTSQINSSGRRQFYSVLLETSTESFRLLTNLIIIFYGSYLILSHTITLGTLVAILGLIGYIRGPMLSLSQDFYSFQKASLAWRRQKNWEELKGEFTQDDRMSHIEIPEIQGTVELKNISFHYNTEKQGKNIDDFSLILEMGKRYAMVGRSGSGKSTILKLLLKFYDPSSGEIIIDGIPLEEIWLPSYRSKVGVVFQESALLTGTVRENISLYRPEATLSEVVEAAKLALLHDDIIKLPLGYDTDLSDKEFGLSGGQKQKLSFCRVFLQKPSLLLLDEPTSAMDKESEDKILKNLHLTFPQKTILMVAHRLETIRNFDAIFVLERGKIAEEGTHKELLAEKGIYHLLYSRQESIR